MKERPILFSDGGAQRRRMSARERPILMSAPMVRAILAGTKTQTRRIVKPQPELNPNYRPSKVDRYERHPEYHWPSNLARSMVTPTEMASIGPYGYRGDRLWVRETWYCDNTTAPNWNPGKKIEATPELIAEWRESLYYRADAVQTGRCCEVIPECACAEYRTAGGRRRSPWRPGIHMPRWACRTELEVTGVRVERLQAITEEDARAEGVEPFLERYPRIGRDQRIDSDLVTEKPHRTSFVCLWDEINGDRALFSSNPWVWVVEFRRLEAAARTP